MCSSRSRSRWPRHESCSSQAAFGQRQPHGAHYRVLLQHAEIEAWSLSKTWPCIVEASHLLDMPRRYTMLRWVGAGALPVFPIDPVSLDDLVALMMQWPERPRTEMHLADASLLWLANDTGVARLMTLDGRDLSRCRLSDGRTSEIL